MERRMNNTRASPSRQYGLFDQKRGEKKRGGKGRGGFSNSRGEQQERGHEKRRDPFEDPQSEKDSFGEREIRDDGKRRYDRNSRGGRQSTERRYKTQRTTETKENSEGKSQITENLEIEKSQKNDEKRQRNEKRRKEGREQRKARMEMQRENEKKMVEEMAKETWKPRRNDVNDVIKEVKDSMTDLDKNKPTEEMCGANDLLEYLYSKQFAPWEVGKDGVPNPILIVKPYKRRTSANEESPCDFRTEAALCDSLAFLLKIMDDPKFENIPLDDKFIYVSERIRSIHTDIIHEGYVSVQIFDITRAVIKFYAFYSFMINSDNFDYAKQQLKQWMLTLRQLYKHINRIKNEEDINYILEDIENDTYDQVLIMNQVQIQEMLDGQNEFDGVLLMIEINEAIKNCEYGRLKTLLKEIPVSIDTIVFHAVFRMRLIEMRHLVFKKWVGTMQLPIPVSFAKDALLYDTEKECVDDLVSCGIDVKDGTFLAKDFDLRDCKRIPRNNSEILIGELEVSKAEVCGDIPWSEFFFGCGEQSSEVTE
ncbi:hypothetical protein EIN_135030 [Entamoeba invadens IP1]|uniref:SAC3/GANP/THP3 conserved domain-containing protein n=1 Tax=Entamoeba invadens IP1 TaxID=370355 RepID=A0A0A1U2Y8_ENTIV|nr:hypothetical protein EIN_135030 [Entamoeba invadens IP1]ELP85919.1 hypothetical protein EIN_135030 [Entamoeba invadens IP1]|eukprot:XP_004185265.1 hypothetical protein EIN_135030 [Entamoeba invadens IP1]